MRWREKYGLIGGARAVAKQAKKQLGWFPPGQKVFAAAQRRIDLLQLRLDSQLFDAKHGTDTSGVISLSKLKLAKSATLGCIRYEAASPLIFRQLMAALEIPFGDFEFVDYGSGKGRVLMLAAQQGFRKATGIEFAAELVEVARKNADIFNRGRAMPTAIETLHMDARDYMLPDVPLVLFFFSPFRGAVLDRVLANITASYRRHPRPLFLVFNGWNPKSIERFCATGFACREVSLQRDPTRFIHYRGLIFAVPLTEMPKIEPALSPLEPLGWRRGIIQVPDARGVPSSAVGQKKSPGREVSARPERVLAGDIERCE
jgi:SAM-dependent methyltransferase